MNSEEHSKSTGQALVEFSLILVVLLLFMFIIVEAGRLFQGWLTVQNSARAGGRYALTGQFETDCLSTFPYCLDARINSIKKEARLAATGLAVDEVTAGQPKSLVVEVWSVNEEGEWEPDYAGGPNKPVRVRVTYYMPLITPILAPIIHTVPLMGQVVVNTENYEQVSSSQAPNAPPDLDDIEENPTDSGLPEADLAIQKSAVFTEVVISGSFQYYLDVTNLGPFDAEQVVVVDTFPTGISDVVGSVSGGGFCDPFDGAANKMTCYLPNLAGDGGFGSDARVTVDLKAPPTVPNPPQIVNSASVSAGPSTIDPDLSNNTSSATVTIRPYTADIEMIKSSDVEALETGQFFNYILTVKNNGPDPADSVVISDTLPAEVDWTGSAVPGCTIAGNVVTCANIFLGVGGVGKEFTIPVEAVKSAPALAENWAEASSSAVEDPNLANNKDNANVFIADKVVDLAVEKTGPQAAVPMLVPYNYSIMITNQSLDNDDDVVVLTDTLPVGLTYFPDASDSRCSEIATGIIRCDLEDLDPGESTIVQISVVAEEPGFLLNTATVSGEEIDSYSANNTDTEMTEVANTDLAIDKVGDLFVDVGETITYTLNIINKGPGLASDVQVVDTLPPGLTEVKAFSNGTCQVSASSVRCGLGAIQPPGGNNTAQVVVTGLAPAVETIINTATVFETASGQPLPDINPIDNTDTITQTNGPLADIQVMKFAIPDYSETASRSRAHLEYLIQVVNKGPFVAPNVRITDTLPVGVIFNGASPGCLFNDLVDPNEVTCDLGDMIPGPTTNITMVVTTTTPSMITNTVLAEADITEPNLSNNISTVVIDVLPADLGVIKLAPDAVFITETLTYTLVVTNYGPSMATNVVLTDTLPEFVTSPQIVTTQGSCNTAGNPITCDLGTMEPGAVITLTLDVMPTKEVQVTNFVEVYAVETLGSDLSDDQAQGTTTVVPIADLEVDKIASGSFYAGEPLTYTITVINNGPSDAFGIEVTDTLPEFVLGASASADLGGSCPDVSDAQVVCQLNQLAIGDSWTITINLVTDADGDFENTAAVTGQIIDLVPGNNVVAISNYIIPNADLEISKETDLGSLLVRRQPVAYTVSIVNNGPSNATGVVIDDLFSGGPLLNVAAPDPRCTVTGPSVACDLGAVPRNGTDSVTVIAWPDFEGDLTDTAVVDNTVETDRTPGNNTVVVTDPIGRSADLAIDKSDDGSLAIAGTTYSYVLVVTNNGPSTSTGGTVDDLLPPRWTFLDSDGSCGPVGSRFFSCTLTGELASGNSETIVITATVPADHLTNVIVTNRTQVAGLDHDAAGGNNIDQEETTVVRHADLTIAKDDGGRTATAGLEFSYALSVTNGGPSTSSGYVVTDTLPAGWSFVSGTDCSLVVDNVFTCTHIAEEALGSTHLYNVTVMVPSSEISGTIRTNSAVVAGIDFDPDLANTATEDTPVIRDGELIIEKANAGVQAVAGETFSYTLKVTNIGPSDSSGGLVSDNLPSGWTLVTSSGGICQGGNLFTCSVNPLAINEFQTFLVTVAVPSSQVPDTVTNFASVKGDETDATNSDIEDTLVVREVDLKLSKTDNEITAVAGDTLTYVLVATNVGPSDASGFTVVDTLPNGWSWAGGDCSSSGASEFSCTNSSGLAANGGTQVFNVVVQVPAGESPGSFRNSALITPASGEIELDNSNNGASDMTDVIRIADLTVDKSDDGSLAVAGSTYEYTLVVTNQGPSVSTSGALTDTLPAGWTVASGDCGTPGQNVFNCAVPTDLGVGSAATYNIVVSIPSSVADGVTMTNTVQLLGSDSAVPDGDQESTTVRRNGVLDIDKSDDGSLAVAGQPYTYTFEVTNLGPSDSSGGIFTDTLPAGWSYSGGDGSGCTPNASGFICPVLPLVSGGSQLFTLSVNVPAGAPSSTANNRVTVIGDQTTTAMSDSEPSDVVREVNLSVTKTDNGIAAVAGQTLSYVITVANNGPSEASGFIVVDTLPSGWSWNSGDCASSGPSEFTCNISSGLAANGGTQVFNVDVLVPAGASPGTYTNDISIAAVSGDSELDNSDNSSSDTTDVIRLAELVVDKSDDGSLATAGATYTYTLVVTNQGPSVSTSGVVTDTLPKGWIVVSGDCGSPGENVFNCALPGDQGVGAANAETFLAVVAIPSSEADGVTVFNAAEVLGSDSTGPNNDQEPTTVIRDAVLDVDKSDDGSLAVAGLPYTYTFAVTNLGPSDSSGGVFTDTLPSGWSYSGGDGSGCSSVASGFTCPVKALAVGELQNFTMVVDVPESEVSQTVTNSVEVQGADTLTSNSDSELTDVVRQVDLTLTVTDNEATAVAGQTITYVVTVINNGPSTSSGYDLTQFLPSWWSWAGGDCGPGGLGTVSCTGAPGLAGNGGTEQFVVEVNVPAFEDTGSHNYSAMIVASGTDVELDGSDNSVNGSTNVIRQVGLDLVKTSSPGPWYVGEVLTYTVQVTNNGPSYASEVKIEDTLPKEITYQNLSSSAPGATCGLNAGVISCTFGSELAVLSTGTLVVSLEPTSTGNATNNSSTSAKETADPADSDSAVTAILPSADLQLSLSGPPSAILSEALTYTISVSNNGPSAQTSVNIITNLPVSLTNPSASVTKGPACLLLSGPVPGTTVRCTPGGMAVGEVVTVTVTAVPTGTGSVSTSSSVAGGVHDPNPANNNAEVTTGVTASFGWAPKEWNFVSMMVIDPGSF